MPKKRRTGGGGGAEGAAEEAAGGGEGEEENLKVSTSVNSRTRLSVRLLLLCFKYLIIGLSKIV